MDAIYFSLPVLFSGTSMFRLLLVLPRSSLSLLQEVRYPLPLEFCPGRLVVLPLVFVGLRLFDVLL